MFGLHTANVVELVKKKCIYEDKLTEGNDNTVYLNERAQKIDSDAQCIISFFWLYCYTCNAKGPKRLYCASNHDMSSNEI